MARERRDDGRRRDSRDSGGGGRLLSFISGLLIGLTVAVVVYFSMLGRPPGGAPEAPTRPAVQPKASAAKAAPEEEPPAEEAAAAPEPPPARSTKPAFDFYKILPDSEVKVPDDELAKPSAPAPAAPAAATAYVLQVGSYQKYEEADQKKAQLALQGITSRIERTVSNGQEVWFRVQVGPLKTPQEAQAMKGRLQEGGSNVVVLKIEGGR